MIKGLAYHFTSTELVNHMMARAEHHNKRAAEKEKVLPEMKASLEKIKKHTPTSVESMSKGSTYSLGTPDIDLEKDITNHRNKAIVFRALADHVVKNEVYELSESDLQRLEITKRPHDY